MEITSKLNPIDNVNNNNNSSSSPLNSPSSHGSTTNSTTTTIPSFPIARSDPNNPYPTTFVTADTNSFKQVVQLLTGSSIKSNSIPPIKTAPTKNHQHQHQHQHRLYERRSFLRNNNLTLNSSGSHRKQTTTTTAPEILSPSLLNFPALTLLSPVTPLTPPVEGLEKEEEERAIAEKGFYLHPSPRSAGEAAAPPRLLPLFPVSSPRESAEE